MKQVAITTMPIIKFQIKVLKISIVMQLEWLKLIKLAWGVWAKSIRSKEKDNGNEYANEVQNHESTKNCSKDKVTFIETSAYSLIRLARYILYVEQYLVN